MIGFEIDTQFVVEYKESGSYVYEFDSNFFPKVKSTIGNLSRAKKFNTRQELDAAMKFHTLAGNYIKILPIQIKYTRMA